MHACIRKAPIDKLEPRWFIEDSNKSDRSFRDKFEYRANFTTVILCRFLTLDGISLLCRAGLYVRTMYPVGVHILS